MEDEVGSLENEGQVFMNAENPLRLPNFNDQTSAAMVITNLG